MKALLLAGAAVLPLLAIAQVAEPSNPSLFQQTVEWLQQAPPAILVVTLFVAPVFGVPLSVLLVILTLAIPLGPALLITLLAVLTHHALIYSLSQTKASGWLRQQLLKRRFLPQRLEHKTYFDDALFLFVVTWVPGLSYVFKLALIALSGMPARVYFPVGIGSQMLAALPYLLLGKVAEQGDFLLLTVLVFLFTLMAWLLKHIIGRRRQSALRESLSGRD